MWINSAFYMFHMLYKGSWKSKFVVLVVCSSNVFVLLKFLVLHIMSLVNSVARLVRQKFVKVKKNKIIFPLKPF